MNAHPADFTPEERVAHFGPQEMVPESLGAEQQLLGAIMLNNDAIDAIRVPIDAKHFYEPLHRRIFSAMQEIYSEGKRINPVSLKGYLPATGKVGDMTIPEYLALLAGSACSVLLASQHAEDIIKASVARDALSVMELVRDAAANRWGELGFIDEITKLSDQLRARVDELSVKEIVRPGDAYVDYFNSTSLNNGAVGVTIAIAAIRKAIGEDVFAAGNVYGLLAASGEGKTSTTMQLIYGALIAGHPVLFLSYDQSAAQCVRQMIAQVHSIDTKQQDDPEHRMSQKERDKCMLFVNWLNEQPFEIIRCRREGITRLLSYAKRFIGKYCKDGEARKTPLVVIDHILKIAPKDERASPDVRSSAINMEAKAFADETQSAFLILNQRNGQGGYRLNPRPTGKDIYGGEGAKQDYDAIAYLYRPQHWREEMLATATKKDLPEINAVFSEFGDRVEEIAEFGALKARFGGRGVREWEIFEARYTRYVSMQPERPAELF